MCPQCGHRWIDHPGALSVRGCATCIYEEDHDDRDETAICGLEVPGVEGEPAGLLLAARIERRRFRGDRILLDDRAGQGWAFIGPAAVGRQDVYSLLREVQSDLAAMPLTQFRDKYRLLLD
jgi:hypothetical protein